MKIYTEVVMQWDDDKGKLVDVSSESYEYSGDVALCGGGKKRWKGYSGNPKFRFHGPTQPGMTAMRLDKYGHKFPTELPGDYSIFPFIPGMGDVQQPQGAQLPNIGDVDPGSKGHHLHREKRHGRKKRTPRGDYLEWAARDYGGKFGSQWYDPYKEAVSKTPLEGIIKEGFAPVSSFLPEGFDFTGPEGAAPPGNIIAPGMGAGSTTPESLGPIVKTTSGGAIGDLGDELELSRGDYDQAMLDREQEDVENLALKKELMSEKDIERRALLRGDIEDIPKREASIARTGMAYSGPAERAIQRAKEGDIGDLATITREKRGYEKDYQKQKDAIQTQREEDYGDLQAAERDFGYELKSILGETTDEATDMFSYLQDLYQGHKDYGSKLLGEMDPGDDLGSGYQMRNLGYSDILGVTGQGYGEPQGGWFREEMQDMPGMGIEQFPKNINAAANFANWMQGLGAQDIAGLIPGSTYNPSTPPPGWATGG